MKYHIDFGESKRLSFEILDNPVAHTWADNLKKVLAGKNLEQEICQQAFAGIYGQQISQFNELKYYYNMLKDLDVVQDLFKLKSNINAYSDTDFAELDIIVDKLFLKVITHNIYYELDTDTLSIVKNCVKRIKLASKQLLDCVYNNNESYAQIRVSSSKYAETLITTDMQEGYFIETIRPKVVIRAYPNFELKSLNIAEQRKNPSLFNNGKYDHQHYITVDHRICFYEDEILTDTLAIKKMKERRAAMLKFVMDNNLDALPGSHPHYYYVNPIVAHLISDEETLAAYLSAVNVGIENQISITIEE